MKTLVETATHAGTFTVLLQAMRSAGLEDMLTGAVQVTLLAPSDHAFANLPQGTVEGLLQNKADLINLLKYHMVDGRNTLQCLTTQGKIITIHGQAVKLFKEPSMVSVNDARVVLNDINASNGIMHVISEVLLPPPG